MRLILCISTHAPVKGATRLSASKTRRMFYFNSRTREGCDYIFTAVLHKCSDFNSRTREGCDKNFLVSTISCEHFNSRTREGCDRITNENINHGIISTHAPVKGATSHGYRAYL